MSTNFSTIRPLDMSTISRKPKYSVDSESPAASMPIGAEPEKKNNHVFLKTVVAAAVLVGAAALATKHINAFKNPIKPADLAKDAKFTEQLQHWGKKALYYGEKAVASVGNFVNENIGRVAKSLKSSGAEAKKSADAGVGAATTKAAEVTEKATEKAKEVTEKVVEKAAEVTEKATEAAAKAAEEAPKA